MVDVLNIVCGTLEPTLTCQRRRFCWAPEREDAPHPDRRLGTLTIVVQHAKGAGCKCEVDHYAVEWVRQGQPELGVYMLNTTNNDGEVYHTRVGIVPVCSCTAGDCKVPSGCKHRDALAALMELGALPAIESRAA